MSDPGTSGVISPYSKIKGLNFDDSLEPDDFKFKYLKEVEKVMEEEGTSHTGITFKNKGEYYEFLNDVHDFVDKNVKVAYTKKESDFDSVQIEDEEDLEDTLSFSVAKREEDRKKEEKSSKKKKK